MNEHSLRTLEYDAIRERLAGEAACSLGVEKALSMLPTDKVQTVQRRLSETAEARDLLAIKGRIPLGGITDIRPLLRKAQIGGALDPEDLLAVASTVGASRALKAFLVKSDVAVFPLMIGYGGRLGVFQSVENEIERAIGPNGQVLDSASPELARARSRKRTAESRLRDRLSAIVTGPLRSYLQDPVIVQRADRSCVPVKAEHRAAFGGIVHDTSASGATLFIEPAVVVDLGNEVREAEVQERQEVIRILLRLTGIVTQFADPIHATVDVLAELDFIVARARLAGHMNAVMPEINSQGITKLQSERHPLIDPEKVVPIDISLGESTNQILLITGPNTGGKTVTLKTVGLLTLMAQSGLHVPAARASMSVFAQVFADIGDEQSIQQSLSTFSSHITNIARILSEVDSNSLVLLDEVGAGTDPGEGAALARALIGYLLIRKVRVIATSHYGELKTYAYTTEGVQNASVEFDEVSLRPTYRLLQGIPGSSNAIAIAGRLGLPADVLESAREYMVGGDDDASDVIKSLEEAKRSAFSEAEAAQQARKEARIFRDKAEQELSQYEQLRHEIRQKALDEARTVIRKAQEKAANLIGDIKRKARAAELDRAETRAREDLRDIEREVTDEIDALLALPKPTEEETLPPPSRPLKAGDKVRVPSLGLMGTLIDTPTEGEKVAVQVGALRVVVPASTLILVGAPGKAALPVPKPVSLAVAVAAVPTETSASEQSVMRSADLSQQLTLLGQRADEASQSIENYLEDVHAAGLNRIRIVHGKGTGVLRRVVHERLTGHPYVEEFALANPDEGGAGATVVLLKG